MRITFHGAAREVTGSCHLIETSDARILLDCGLIQGGKERHERNREPFPFDARELDAVLLSHAHIDHSGRLPLLCKAGYRGKIYATPATVSLCEILLRDSAHIHEEDARWKIKRLKKKRMPYAWVEPLYTSEDVECILDRFVPVEFGERRSLDGAGEFSFARAGHILGAAITELDVRENGQSRRITFSGDLGVPAARLISEPDRVDCPDYLLIESTYGDRERSDSGDRSEHLYRVIERTTNRGGKLVIPSFAVGRTQALLARINDLVESGRLPRLRVYVDSPMAVAATRVFTQHPGAYSEEARRLIQAGDEPLEFPGLELVTAVEDSMAINEFDGPCVIISASGMATAGRIKHHLKHNISDSRSTILFVGYQAAGSLGRVIQSGVTPIRIFGDWYPVRADVETIQGFSAHADLGELLSWYRGLDGNPRRAFVVHGEEDVALKFASTLDDTFSANAEAPRRGQSFVLS